MPECNPCTPIARQELDRLRALGWTIEEIIAATLLELLRRPVVRSPDRIHHDVVHYYDE